MLKLKQIFEYQTIDTSGVFDGLPYEVLDVISGNIIDYGLQSNAVSGTFFFRQDWFCANLPVSINTSTLAGTLGWMQACWQIFLVNGLKQCMKIGSILPIQFR